MPGKVPDVGWWKVLKLDFNIDINTVWTQAKQKVELPAYKDSQDFLNFYKSNTILNSIQLYYEWHDLILFRLFLLFQKGQAKVKIIIPNLEVF